MGSNGSYDVSSENQWQDYQNEYLTQLSLILGGIAAISLLVGGIGIMNIMLVTVTERTREIGIRRAIGAQRASIVAQFLIEAAMLCGIGGLVGIAVGTLGSVVLSTFFWCRSQCSPFVGDGGGICTVRGTWGFVRHLPCGQGV